MSYNDGGPAFPTNSWGTSQGSSGMSLRDWFAAHAPEPTEEEIDSYINRENPQNFASVKARLRYQWADYMIEARGKQY